jgi:hypothetical protein
MFAWGLLLQATVSGTSTVSGTVVNANTSATLSGVQP